MKLLLHTCCAPCSIQCVGTLAAEGVQPDLFWFNPNIHPYTEYRSRRDSLLQFAEDNKLPLLIEDEYGIRSFINGIIADDLIADKAIAVGRNAAGSSAAVPAPREDFSGPKRCAFCYRLRLEKAARVAAEKGYDAFSTSLLISPHQNHELIRQIGGEQASTFGVEFLYRDFRPRFREGQSRARVAGYYMQKYCGCIFSEEERYLSTKRDGK